MGKVDHSSINYGKRMKMSLLENLLLTDAKKEWPWKNKPMNPVR